MSKGNKFSKILREIVFKLSEIDPDRLIRSKKIPNDFEIKIKFVRICNCNNREYPINICEMCSKFVQKNVNSWQFIQSILDVSTIFYFRIIKQMLMKEERFYLEILLKMT